MSTLKPRHDPEVNHSTKTTESCVTGANSATPRYPSVCSNEHASKMENGRTFKNATLGKSNKSSKKNRSRKTSVGSEDDGFFRCSNDGPETKRGSLNERLSGSDLNNKMTQCNMDCFRLDAIFPNELNLILSNINLLILSLKKNPEQFAFVRTLHELILKLLNILTELSKSPLEQKSVLSEATQRFENASECLNQILNQHFMGSQKRMEDLVVEIDIMEKQLEDVEREICQQEVSNALNKEDVGTTCTDDIETQLRNAIRENGQLHAEYEFYKEKLESFRKLIDEKELGILMKEKKKKKQQQKKKSK